MLTTEPITEVSDPILQEKQASTFALLALFRKKVDELSDSCPGAFIANDRLTALEQALSAGTSGFLLAYVSSKSEDADPDRLGIFSRVDQFLRREWKSKAALRAVAKTKLQAENLKSSATHLRMAWHTVTGLMIAMALISAFIHQPLVGFGFCLLNLVIGLTVVRHFKGLRAKLAELDAYVRKSDGMWNTARSSSNNLAEELKTKVVLEELINVMKNIVDLKPYCPEAAAVERVLHQEMMEMLAGGIE